MNILVFQHVAHETPGLIGDYAKKKGIQLDNFMNLVNSHV